ncbi:MAG: 50S ribosomal protein L5 [Planctomycetes bacterium]|nr:50S ribosomal protein L5 [Planctomycetota bacterium]
MPRLKTKYQQVVVGQLKEALGTPNRMAIPRLQKIVCNMGVGRARDNKRILESVSKELGQITGQKPVITKARGSEAGFKIRTGDPIGCKVTLRGNRMWEFLDRLITIAIPRIKDFRGLSMKAFDGNGNYSMGLSEQLVFPEIHPDKVEFQQGMNITFVISGGNDDDSRELLRFMGMPLQRAGE